MTTTSRQLNAVSRAPSGGVALSTSNAAGVAVEPLTSSAYAPEPVTVRKERARIPD